MSAAETAGSEWRETEDAVSPAAEEDWEDVEDGECEEEEDTDGVDRSDGTKRARGPQPAIPLTS
jgi:hypothetical protein